MQEIKQLKEINIKISEIKDQNSKNYYNLLYYPNLIYKIY